jgi:hypothetical protein
MAERLHSRMATEGVGQNHYQGNLI